MFPTPHRQFLEIHGNKLKPSDWQTEGVPWYTTNAIENFNRQLRKVSKTKSAGLSDDALMKIL